MNIFFSFFRSQRLVDKGLINTFFSRFIRYCLINQLPKRAVGYSYFSRQCGLMTGWDCSVLLRWAVLSWTFIQLLFSKLMTRMPDFNAAIGTLTFSHYEVLLAYVQSLGRAAKEETSKKVTWNSFWPACFRWSFSFLNLYLTKLFYSRVIASTGCLFYRSLNIYFRLSLMQFKLFGWSRITVYYSHLFWRNLR